MNNVQYVFFRQLLISLYSSNLFVFFVSSRFLRSHTHCLRLGNQEISELTLMHHEHNATGLYYAFPLFFRVPVTGFPFRLLFVSCFCCLVFLFLGECRHLFRCPCSFPAFFMNVIYCTCNELFFFIATFNSRSLGSRLGFEFLT